MTLLFYSPAFLNHDTGQHPECAARLLPAVRQIHKSSAYFPLIRPEIQPISLDRLERIHSAQYIQLVRDFANGGGGLFEADTIVSRASFQVALLAAGAVYDAVRRVVRGEDHHAFCLVRPPGHHALRSQAMGFCLFNNVAVGARQAIVEFDLDRVLIVDWDVHHGNGTQAAFWEDPQVGFFSIHRYPFYPGTGAADETGGGKGLGTTLNLPIKFGTSRHDYLAQFTTAIERFAEKIKPQLVLISAGFDSHHLDPIGSLGLESADFGILTRVVQDIAGAYAGNKIVSVLEGGYNPQALAECIDIHLHELDVGS